MSIEEKEVNKCYICDRCELRYIEPAPKRFYTKKAHLTKFRFTPSAIETNAVNNIFVDVNSYIEGYNREKLHYCKKCTIEILEEALEKAKLI